MTIIKEEIEGALEFAIGVAIAVLLTAIVMTGSAGADFD